MFVWLFALAGWVFVAELRFQMSTVCICYFEKFTDTSINLNEATVLAYDFNLDASINIHFCSNLHTDINVFWPFMFAVSN